MEENYDNSRLTLFERTCKAIPAFAMLTALVSIGALLIYYGFWALSALRNYILEIIPQLIKELIQ